MLDQKDIQKFVKPFIISLGFKTTFFLIILIILATNNLTGLSSENGPISHCDSYLNLKLSLYRSKTLMAQFSLTLCSFLASMAGFLSFGSFFIVLRKEQKQTTTGKIRLSQNQIRFHFILAFIELLGIFNIFLRSIQKLNQQTACNLEKKSSLILGLTFSILALISSALGLFILFKFSILIQSKLKSLEEFNFYSDQITLQQNLLFNKFGYIKELLKLDDYSSKSSSLKDEFMKGVPSGFRKNDEISVKRQIVNRLRGGNKSDNLEVKTNSKKKQKQKTQQEDFDFQFQINAEQISQNRNQSLRTPTNQQKIKRLDLLAVNEKNFDQGPNDQNLQNIQLALNVIGLNIDRQMLKDLNSLSEEGQQEEPYVNNGQLIKLQRITQNPANQLNLPKKDKKVSIQIKQEEELRQKFNLTPNVQIRRKYGNVKNGQNIDDHGNYYYVDVEKIKKTSKLLNFQKLIQDANTVDPNLLYTKKQWSPKQKRLSKRHERYMAEYLKNLEKIKKQEMFLYKQKSEYDQNFQESELTSNSDSQSDSNQGVPVTQIDPLTGQPVIVKIEEVKQKRNKQPELYLHLKKKKKTAMQNKLKLYEEESGFYDSEPEGEDQSLQAGFIRDLQSRLQRNQSAQKGQSKEHQQKTRMQEKDALQNMELETEEARMLRFIRKKYLLHSSSRQRQHYQGENSLQVEEIQIYSPRNQNSIFLPLVQPEDH